MNEGLLDRVKDYFDGKMSHEERLQLESEMAVNTELATIFDLYQTIENGIFETEEVSEEEVLLRQSLRGAHARFLEKHGHGQDTAGRSDEDGQTGSLHAAAPETGNPEFKEVVMPVQEKSKGKVISMKLWKVLAVAAVATGIVLTATVWLFQKNQGSRELAAGRTRKATKPADVAVPDTSFTAPPVTKPEPPIARQEEPKVPGQTPESKKTAVPRIPSKAEQQELYARNFKPDALPPDFNDRLQEALRQYEGGQYEDAVAAIDIEAIETYLEEIRPRGVQDETMAKEERRTLFYAHYYKALSYMGDGSAQKAVPEFQKALVHSPDKFWQSKAQWYLALAYLKVGKAKEAKVQLKKVTQTARAGEYQQKAAKLIRELEEN